jgi:hypothetical protein
MDFRRPTRPIYRQPRYRCVNLTPGFPIFLFDGPTYYRRKPSILTRRAPLARIGYSNDFWQRRQARQLRWSQYSAQVPL